MTGIARRLGSIPSSIEADLPVARQGLLRQVTDALPGLREATPYGFVRLAGRRLDPKLFGAIGDGSAHPLSERFGSLAAAQVKYPRALDLDEPIDYHAVTKAIDALAANARGGLVDFSDGDYSQHIPYQLPSHVYLHAAPGVDARLTNTHDGTSQVSTGINVLTGNFHPADLHIEGGSMTYDTLAPVSVGQHEVTLTTSTLMYAVGDLVMVYFSDVGDLEPTPYLCRLVAVDGAVLTLDRAIDDDPAGADAFITKGVGASFNLTPLSGVNVPAASYFCENCGVIGLSMSAGITTSWTGRAAVLDGLFQRLSILRSRNGLIYGNAYTDCLFEGIRGVFSRRIVEITDGGRGNVARNLRAYYVDDGGLVDQTGVQPGNRTLFEDFAFYDGSDRSAPALAPIWPGCTIRNGRIVVGGIPHTSTVQLATRAKGLKMAAVEVVVSQPIPTDKFALVVNALEGEVEGLNVVATYSGGDAVRLQGDLAGFRMTGVRAPNGGLSAAAGTSLVNAVIAECDFLDLGAQSALIAGVAQGQGNVFRNRSGIASLRSKGLTNQTITATTETALITHTLTTQQSLFINDLILLTAMIDVTGTAGDKRLKVVFGGVTAADITIPAANVGDYLLEVWVEHENAITTSGIHELTYRLTKPDGTATFSTTRSAVVSLAAAATIEVRAWKVASGDSMVVRSCQFTPRLALA